jgi:2-haloacid dehalogenase
MPACAAYVFDAYGTLFDVHSAVGRYRDKIGPEADRMSEVWRTKQLEYTWVRTLMGAYRDFKALTEEALDFAAQRCGGLDPSVRTALLKAYEELDAFADVKPVLTKLKESGARIAILSNGTPAMLASAVASAGLSDLIEANISINEVRQFKTAPAAYALVSKRLGVAANEVSFQSSNRWDVAGAVKFGFEGVWINRTGAPDEYPDLAPTRVLSGLSELLTN